MNAEQTIETYLRVLREHGGDPKGKTIAFETPMTVDEASELKVKYPDLHLVIPLKTEEEFVQSRMTVKGCEVIKLRDPEVTNV